MGSTTSSLRANARIVLAAAAAVPVIGMCVQPTLGATLFWDGDGTSPQAGGAGTWNTTAARFSTTAGGTVDQIWNNANVDSATLNGTAGVVNLAGPITVHQINTTVSGYTIGNGNGVGGAANTLTFSGVDAGINVATGVTTLTALVSGTFTKTGAGRVEVNNTANPNTSKWVMKGGALTAPAISRYGTLPGALVSDFFTFDGGGMGFSTTTTGIDTGATRGVTINAGGAFLSVSNAAVLVTISGPIVGTANGDLTITGGGVFTGTPHTVGGVWTLTNTNNTFNGNVNISGASGSALRVGASGVIPDTAMVNITAAGNTLDLSQVANITETIRTLQGTAGTVALGSSGHLILNNPTGQTYSSVFTGTAGSRITKNGSGVQILSGGSSGFSGEFILNNGTVGVGSTGTFGSSATGTGPKLSINGGVLANTAVTGRTMSANLDVDMNADFTVDDSLISGPGQILFGGDNTIRLSNRTITVNGTANLGFASPIGEDVAGRTLTKAGGGILAFTSGTASTYTGQTTVLAGKLQVDGDGQIGPAQLNLDGGIYNASAARTVATPNTINLVSDSAITTTSAATNADMELSGPLTGSAGTLTFRNDGGTVASDVFNARLSGSGYTFARPIIIDNGSTGGTTELTGFNPAATSQTLSGDISGNGGFTRSASVAGVAGETILSGNNTFTGPTDVFRGTLTLASFGGQALGGTSAISIDTDGILNLAQWNQVNDLAPVTFAGSRLNTNGNSETMGVLNAPNASTSIIDLGSGSSILAFADSSGSTWNVGHVIQVWNWSGVPFFGNGTDQLFFGTNTAGLTLAQLGQINFYSDNGTTLLGGGGAVFAADSDGEVVPTPEPVGLGLLAIGAPLLLRRRRR